LAFDKKIRGGQHNTAASRYANPAQKPTAAEALKYARATILSLAARSRIGMD
jgi:hypothetical protein